MTKDQLIKSGHIWALAVLLAFGVIALASKSETGSQHSDQQNANSNSNSNTSRTQNSNTSRAKNRNSNTGNNSNTSAAGERTGMAAMSSQDTNFLMEAAIGGMMEVELGRIAARQGNSDAVKQFGQRMVDDHSQANTELMQLASSKGVTLPTQLDEKHRDEITKMSKMSGAEFDRAYSKMMVSDHNKDVAEFQKESTKGADAYVKAFAAKTLPTLQEHLQLAKALSGSPKSTTTGTKNSNSNRP
jgi:putative membrane protein